MPTLTQQQISELSSIAAKTRAQFTTADAIRYYEILHQAGFEYGTRALSVVIEADPTNSNYTQYSNLQGKLANEYSFIVADRNGVDFTVGNITWVTMEHRLLQNDWSDRQGDPSVELTYADISENHTEAFSRVGLPPETFTTHRLLEQLNEVSPTAAEIVWNELKSGDGLYDFIVPDAPYGAAVGIFTAYIPTLSPYEKAEGLYERGLWMADIFKALLNIAPSALEEEFPQQDYPKLWDALELAQEHGVADWLDPALSGAAAGAQPALPAWMQLLLSDWDQAKNEGSPLVLDLDGNGVELASVLGTGAVFWDIDEDGFAEQSGWTAGNDGLLAIDLNADGAIDQHSELFGSLTVDGFTALSAYDSNSDGVIDSNDAQFGDLLVWVDANGDAVSEASELSSLSSLGITSINLNASQVSYDIAGNHVTHESTFTINAQAQTIVDAWFTYNPTNSIYVDDYTLDVETLYLPTLRGFGDVKDLHIAMSEDSTLLDMVKEIATADTATLFSSAFDLNGKFEDILFRWTGVESISPTSRGAYVDGQHLAFMEKYLGEGYLQEGTTPDPGFGPAPILDAIYGELAERLLSQFLVQTSANAFFEDTAAYNFLTGEIDGSVMDLATVVEAGQSSVTTSVENNVYVLSDESTSITISEQGGDDTIWVSNLTAEEIGVKNNGNASLDIQIGTQTIVFSDHFSSFSQPSLEGARVERLVLDDGTVFDLVNNITFRGLAGNDSLVGTANNDTILGGAGNDSLYGQAGNDTLNGQAGDDVLDGGYGDDTYVYELGGGTDDITDFGGVDVLSFGAGITVDDLTFKKVSNHLQIWIGSDKIEIDYQFQSGWGYEIETATFDDGSSISLLNGLTFTGTSGVDYLFATSGGSGLEGLAGNDELYGAAGDDVLDGGAGNDRLYGDQGSDTYLFAIGDGTDTITDYGGAADKIVFGDGITADDLRLTKVGQDLKIWLGNESIEIDYQFNASCGYEIETAEFSDSSTMSLLNNLTFTGTSSGEDLYGTSGDDVLYGRGGADNLYGEGGADVFAYLDADMDGTSDIIGDFSTAQNDALDLSDLLFGYDPVNDAITDFVWITNAGSNSDVYVDQDGTGTSETWTKIATLQYVTGLTDEAALEANGTLIAA